METDTLAPIDRQQIDLLATVVTQIVEQWLKAEVRPENLNEIVKDGPSIMLEFLWARQRIAVQTSADAQEAGFVRLTNLAQAVLLRCLTGMGLTRASIEIEKIGERYVTVNDAYRTEISDFLKPKNAFFIGYQRSEFVIERVSIMGFDLKKYLGRISFEFIKEHATEVYIGHIKEMAASDLHHKNAAALYGNTTPPAIN